MTRRLVLPFTTMLSGNPPTPARAPSEGLIERGALKQLMAIADLRSGETAELYKACLQAGTAAAILDLSSDSVLDDTITKLQPDICALKTSRWSHEAADRHGYVEAANYGHYRLWQRSHAAETTLDEELGLVLATSGSTSAPKWVRLSYENISASAQGIVSALGLRDEHMGVVALPLSYTYGLSIVHAHSWVGGHCAVTSMSIASARFWYWVRDLERPIVLYTVPTTLRLLAASGWRWTDHPHLRKLCTSGAAIDAQTSSYFAEQGGDGREFFRMYGQTEACSRMTVLPADKAAGDQWAGSVGRPIPGTVVSIVDEDGAALPEGQWGRIRYEGANVMMGYARTRSDLGRGNELKGVLETNDRGLVKDSFVWLDGRVDNDIKVLGIRVNLDALSRELSGVVEVVVLAVVSDQILVVAEGNPVGLKDKVRQAALQRGLPDGVFRLMTLARFPRLDSGKVDRRGLVSDIGLNPLD